MPAGRSRMEYKKIIPAADILRAECVLAQNGKAESITSVHKRTGADIVLNTALFDMRSYAILSRVVAGGKRYGNSETYGIGFGPAPVWTYDNGAACPHYVGAYTYAVMGGKVSDGLKDSGKRGRTALGLTANGDLVIYVVTDNDSRKCSTLTLCQRMLDLGCVNAINLDGGGSSQAITPEGAYNSGRAVPAYLCIWLRETDKEGDKMRYTVTASALNIRSGPGTSYKVVGSYPKGTPVNIVATKNGWGQMALGWMSMDYLTPDKPDGISTDYPCNTANYRKGRKQDIRYIVIHYVGELGSALNNAKYFSGTAGLGMSAHYFVGHAAENAKVYQSVQDEDTAWHCGADSYKHPTCRNDNSIGVELCCHQDSAGKWYFDQATVDRAVELVRGLMGRYGIDADHVLRHYDITGKNCPAPMVNDPAAWAAFKARLGGEAAPEPELDNTPDTYAAEAVAWAKSAGLLQGDETGNMHLHGNLTRQDAAVLLYRAREV